MDDDVLGQIHKECITNCITNTLCSGVISWPMLCSRETLPLWGART